MTDSDPRTDETLVRGANRGDARAFEALYLRYRDWVVRLAHRFTGNDEDALDVLQDTFAYLLGKLPELTLSARMTTFLYPAVKNLSLAVIRKRKRLTLQDDALARVPDRAGDPRAVPADRDELGRVLAVLPEAQREVLLMRVVDEMSLADIAQALAVPLGTVKSRLHTALETLRADPRTRSYFLDWMRSMCHGRSRPTLDQFRSGHEPPLPGKKRGAVNLLPASCA